MNLLYMKYAVEVAACGSINKAAEKLFLDQPNLSRAIKELEADLGVAVFERSTKGMKPTPDGEVFLKYARNILSQVDAVEHMFHGGEALTRRFSVSVPRASYICEAFAAFSASLAGLPQAEVLYRETNSMRTLRNLLENGYKLGIVRYAEAYDKYYKTALEEKGLTAELVTEFRYQLLMSAASPLAKLEHITRADLRHHIEIAHGDPYVPSLPMAEVRQAELPDADRRIYVFERASQFELLSSNLDTFMWVSPVPARLLERYGLVQRPCAENPRVYKDVMIYRKDYKLTDLDQAFISELCRVRREVFSDRAGKSSVV